MRNRTLPLSVFPGAGLLAMAVFAIAAEAPSPAAIDKLIQQLGSPAFEEREKATQSLDQVGASALEALRKAMSSNDASSVSPP